MTRIKAASLDLILAANGQKTTDELRFAMSEEKRKRSLEIQSKEVRPLTAQQRKQLRRVMAKAGLDIFGNPLNQDGGTP